MTPAVCRIMAAFVAGILLFSWHVVAAAAVASQSKSADDVGTLAVVEDADAGNYYAISAGHLRGAPHTGHVNKGDIVTDLTTGMQAAEAGGDSKNMGRVAQTQRRLLVNVDADDGAALLAQVQAFTNAATELPSTSVDFCQGDWQTFIACDESGRVTEIWMGASDLSGTLSSQLGALTKLTVVSLEENQLSGTIPPELGRLQSLQSLSLFYQQLSGTIPPELGLSQSLQELTLGDNQLTGTIFPELGQLQSLTYLALDGNRLNGTIPPELGQLQSLRSLILRGNQLVGTIPPEVGQLQSLTTLLLNENQLMGTIPPELGQFQSIFQIHLEVNQLSGTIPPELGQLQSLFWLTLEGNRLVGTIPPELGQLPTLKLLGVRDNPLICGPMPSRAGLTVWAGGNYGPSCPACFDTASAPDVDWNCPAATPDCVGNANCYRLNPSCYFSDRDFIHDNNSVCPSPLHVNALISLSLINCTTTSISLANISAALASDAFLGLPACAIELALWEPPMNTSTGEDDPTSDSDDSDDDRRRRKLLADGGDILLALRAYVESGPQGEHVRDLLNSQQGRDRMAEVVFALVGTAVDVQVQAVFDTPPLASVQSDPHFTTATGLKFDWNGVAGHSYCIVTDKQVQINARFVGAVNSVQAVSASQPDTRTWMDQIGILYGTDRILIDAKAAPGTAFAVSFGTVRINGELLLGRQATMKLPSGVIVTRSRTRVLVAIPRVMVTEVEVVRAAFWEQGAGPSTNFLNLQVKQFDNSADVHGILGQSYANPNSRYPVEGDTKDYMTTGVLATDCRFTRFIK